VKPASALAAFLLTTTLPAQAQENLPPMVQIVEAGPFSSETLPISYLLFDAEEDAGALRYALYAYPDNRLSTVGQVLNFATMIADEQDLLNAKGTGDFAESLSGADVQTYTWDDPGPGLRPLGFAALNRLLDGSYYLYLVADDGINAPVFAVSAAPVRIDRSAPATAVKQATWAEVKTSRY
jgi:hypothetical protein